MKSIKRQPSQVVYMLHICTLHKRNLWLQPCTHDPLTPWHREVMHPKHASTGNAKTLSATSWCDCTANERCVKTLGKTIFWPWCLAFHAVLFQIGLWGVRIVWINQWKMENTGRMKTAMNKLVGGIFHLEKEMLLTLAMTDVRCQREENVFGNYTDVREKITT